MKQKTIDIARSPCLTCINMGIDKNRCAPQCRRLRAYNVGKDWTKEEVFIVPEEKNLVEDLENNDFFVPDLEAEAEMDDEEATDESKKPGPVKHVKPQPPWKKAMPVKKKEPVQECAICGKERVPGVKFLRGVCAVPCYMAWRRGRIVHPTLGAFKKVLLVEDVIATTLAEKTAPRHVAVDEVDEVDETIDLISINLNLKPYPVISEKIRRIAERLSLPISHVVFSLLGEALAERKERTH